MGQLFHKRFKLDRERLPPPGFRGAGQHLPLPWQECRLAMAPWALPTVGLYASSALRCLSKYTVSGASNDFDVRPTLLNAFYCCQLLLQCFILMTTFKLYCRCCQAVATLILLLLLVLLSDIVVAAAAAAAAYYGLFSAASLPLLLLLVVVMQIGLLLLMLTLLLLLALMPYCLHWCWFSCYACAGRYLFDATCCWLESTTSRWLLTSLVFAFVSHAATCAGTCLSYTQHKTYIDAALGDNNIYADKSTHVTRIYAATLMLTMGVPLEAIQRSGGWKQDSLGTSYIVFAMNPQALLALAMWRTDKVDNHCFYDPRMRAAVPQEFIEHAWPGLQQFIAEIEDAIPAALAGDKAAAEIARHRHIARVFHAVISVAIQDAVELADTYPDNPFIADMKQHPLFR